jgi:hypothetical protein
MSKKCITALAILFVALLATPVALAQGAGQSPASGGDTDAADVVVLLDVSQSALPYFQDVTDFVVGSVVRDYLRRGDTFHLLSFGETAQSEIAQRMMSEADVKSVLGRLYLLYPLARYSDFVGALSYLYQYVADLPESRRKVVIVITDGVHNPPPGSPTFGMEPDKVASAIEAAAARIRANGWPVHIIKLPFPKPGEPGAPSSGSAEARGKSYLDVAAGSLGAEVSEFSRDGKADLARKSLSLPTAEFPGPLGKKDYSFSFPLRLKNGSDAAVGLELDRVRLGDADILSKKVFLTLQSGRSGSVNIPVLIPETVPEGDSKLGVQLHFANGIRVSPDSGTLELTLAKNPVAAFLRSGARVALFIVLVVLLLGAFLALILMLRRMPKRAEAPIAAAVLQADADSRTASTAASRGGARREAAQATLASAAATSAADKGARVASSDASAAAIAAMAREEAAESAALLAEAAAKAREESRAESAAEAPANARRRGARKAEAREEAADASAAALARQSRDEAERTFALLKEASGRRTPARRPSSAEEAEARAAAAAYAPRVVKPGSIQVEFLVAEQNPHIGSRNVHSLSAGGSRSVGGGASDFLVFLVSVPRRSAELHYDGEKLTFVPLRPELFPELSGPVEDCLGVDIPMISRSGYPLTLRFAPYEKPADKINRLLHSIETPGLFK